jgi:hypothetical protein
MKLMTLRACRETTMADVGTFRTTIAIENLLERGKRRALPSGVGVSGLESDGADRFFCAGGTHAKRGGGGAKVRAVRRPG